MYVCIYIYVYVYIYVYIYIYLLHSAYHLRIKVEATKISVAFVRLILILSREHVHMVTIPLGCIFSILKHIELKVCNTNNAASKADSKHTKKQAPSLRGTIINM